MPKVAIADPNHFTFAMVGDLHIRGTGTGRFRQILSDAAAEGDSFIVLLGDLVELGDAVSYDALLQAISDSGWTGKVVAVIGNHDVFENGWGQFRDKIGPSLYSVTVGNCNFIVLDTASGTVGFDQLKWFKIQLTASAATNPIVLSHYPLLFLRPFATNSKDESRPIRKRCGSPAWRRSTECGLGSLPITTAISIKSSEAWITSSPVAAVGGGCLPKKNTSSCR